MLIDILGTGLILTPLNGFKLGTWLRKKPFTLMLETYAFASQTDNAPITGLVAKQASCKAYDAVTEAIVP